MMKQQNFQQRLSIMKSEKRKKNLKKQSKKGKKKVKRLKKKPSSMDLQPYLNNLKFCMSGG